MLVAGRRGVAVHLHTPSEVKAAITGSGRAGKDQVGAMVTRILRLEEAPRPADAADALALAICHVWRGGTTARLDAAMESGRRSRRVPRSGRGDSGRRAARDRAGQRAGAAGGPDVGGGRGRRPRRPRAVQPQHRRRAAGRAAGHAGHLAGRPRGLAHPLRVRHRRRAGVLRAAADRHRGRARSWPRRRWPCSARTSCARRSPTENLVQLCKVPGIGRKGAQRIVIELKDKINAVALPERAVAADRGRRPRPGGTR